MNIEEIKKIEEEAKKNCFKIHNFKTDKQGLPKFLEPYSEEKLNPDTNQNFWCHKIRAKLFAQIDKYKKFYVLPDGRTFFYNYHEIDHVFSTCRVIEYKSFDEWITARQNFDEWGERVNEKTFTLIRGEEFEIVGKWDVDRFHGPYPIISGDFKIFPLKNILKDVSGETYRFMWEKTKEKKKEYFLSFYDSSAMDNPRIIRSKLRKKLYYLQYKEGE